MNRLGMVIDVSHMAEGTFWDVIQVSVVPIIASHSGVKALTFQMINFGMYTPP